MRQEYEVVELPIDDIKPSPDNPRKTFDENKLEALKGSIESRDLTEPILIRKADGHIIKGERRYRAEKLAGRKTIQVRVYDVDSFRAKEMRLEQEVDIDDREKENAFYDLWIEGHERGIYEDMTDMAKAVGSSKATVYELILAKQERLSAGNKSVLKEVSARDLRETRKLREVDPKAGLELLKARAKGEMFKDEMVAVAKTAVELENPEERLGYIKEQEAILRDQKAERERAERLRKESAKETKAGRPPTLVTMDNSQRRHDDDKVAGFEKLWRNVDIYLRPEPIKEVSHKHKREMCIAYVRMIADRANSVLASVGDEILEGEIIDEVREP